MYLKNGFLEGNKFWKYIVGFVIITIATFIVGQLPFLGAVKYESMRSNKPIPLNDKDVMGFLEPNVSLFFIMVSFAFTLGAIFLVAKKIHGQTITSLTSSREAIDFKRIFFSFIIWSSFASGMLLLDYFLSPEKFVFNFQPVPFLILAIIAVLLIPIQTSAEEYFFRGYLMQGLALLTKNKWFPLLFTSMAFGLMHIANPEVQKMGNIIMIYYIGTGLFLGIITLMDEGMELALGFHAANNLTTALLVTSDWSAFQTYAIFKDISEPSLGFEVVIPVIVIFPILLFIFSKKYNWNNWGDKLFGTIKIDKNNLTESV